MGSLTPDGVDLSLEERGACFLPRAPPPDFISTPLPIYTGSHEMRLAGGPSPGPTSPLELGPIRTEQLTKLSFQRAVAVAALSEQHQTQ